jgi:hypothetical protein
MTVARRNPLHREIITPKTPGTLITSLTSITWAQVDKTTSDIADVTTKSHTSLTNIGTNTHAQIDTHISTVYLMGTTGTGRTPYHIVEGSVALIAGTATVTLTNGAVFTSSTSYTVCVTRGVTTSFQVVNSSGSQFVITSSNGADTDTIRFIAIGD